MEVDQASIDGALTEYKAEIDRQAEENITNFSDWLDEAFNTIKDFTD